MLPTCVRAAMSGVTRAELARIYGLAAWNVSQMLTGDGWSHVTDPPPLPRLGQRPMAKLSDELVREGLRRRERGETVTHIAREFGVSTPTMAKALRGQTWRSARVQS